jgi:phage head maturation protease
MGRAIDGLSIGFRRQSAHRSRTRIRRICRRLGEISIVTFPMLTGRVCAQSSATARTRAEQEWAPSARSGMDRAVETRPTFI